MKRVLFLLVIFGFSGIFASLNRPDAAGDPLSAAGIVKVKKPISAPIFAIEDMDGKRLSLNDFQGKIVLLDFWATW
jgi:cytochrome oxidase Cu insertion factor (SCO1/SenC/PrrC family)